MPSFSTGSKSMSLVCGNAVQTTRISSGLQLITSPRHIQMVRKLWFHGGVFTPVFRMFSEAFTHVIFSKEQMVQRVMRIFHRAYNNQQQATLV